MSQELVFTDTASLQAHYAAVRQRIWAQKPVHVNPEKVAIVPRPQYPTSADLIAAHNEIESAVTGMGAPIIFISTIVAAVSKASGISAQDICGPSRRHKFAHARQVVCWIAKIRSTRSLPEIGRRLGGRDHSTILHSIRKVKARPHEFADLIAATNLILDGENQ